MIIISNNDIMLVALVKNSARQPGLIARLTQHPPNQRPSFQPASLDWGLLLRELTGLSAAGSPGRGTKLHEASR